MSFHEALLDAPLPKLLVFAGICFIGLAIIKQYKDDVEVDSAGRVVAFVAGFVLIGLGLVLVPLTAPDSGSDPPGEVAAVSGPTLTPSGGDVTPPEQVTPVDQSLADTTPVQATPPPPSAGGTVFEQEPNDAAASALLVERGLTARGEIRSTYDVDPSMDSDYYAVWVDAGETLSVDISRDGGSGTVYAVVLDPNGISEPNGEWLSDIVPVAPGERVRLQTVASQSGYHYVLVSGWIYLIDLDLYFNDGGNGDYSVVVGQNERAAVELRARSAMR